MIASDGYHVAAPSAGGRLLVHDQGCQVAHGGEVVDDDLLVVDHDAERVLEMAGELQQVAGVEGGR